jgi:uncharacterized iron-regulated membrane protein
VYRVHSSRDVVRWGGTRVGIDASTGALTGIEVGTGHRAGNTFTSWIKGLHMAMVFGWPWKIVVTLMGVVVATLALTGVALWGRRVIRRHS